MLIVRDAPITTVGSGGYLRSLQIAELLALHGYATVDLLPGTLKPRDRLERQHRKRRMKMLARHASPHEQGDRMQRKRTAMQYENTAALIDSLPNVDLFVWERTTRHGSLAAARARAIPTVAFCHNLESLVPDEQLSYAPQGDPHARFAAECEKLAAADARVVISSRDQWLLGLFGIESHHLPYFPPAARSRWLATIRAERAPEAAPRRLLLMGSAFYGPNHDGMRRMLGLLSSLPAVGGSLVIDVAGFGSERLRDACNGPGVCFHGAVSDTDLATLMRGASAAIIFQHSGSGVLTRITDYLLAGLPVLANPVAARDHEHEPDVHIFRDDTELAGLVAEWPFAHRARAPRDPARASARVGEWLAGLVGPRRAG
ncbi:glycosyltransferase family 1 protein [Salinisphaera sp. Q1T1-3]|uniref:glycosyltransferase family 1 protein n=1 Tax=Salinisphaera sp. Q1T1-3 TaxID=2321229 RepID=UPI000E71B0A5|nr:glycosyltransferase family 1 protein [Salinisphaera sp. Q1T1-3]RJS94691.1 glycosyltransferase family 1 protein [Salinisphaera sp. Q1T1-3]